MPLFYESLWYFWIKKPNPLNGLPMGGVFKDGRHLSVAYHLLPTAFGEEDDIFV